MLCACALQISTVCSNLAAAIADLVHLPGTVLDMAAWKHHVLMLSSKLIVGWRPRIRHLTIKQSQLEDASLDLLLSQTCIEILYVSCRWPGAARQLGRLFEKHKSTLNIADMFHGGYLPHCLLPTLQVLEFTDHGYGFLGDWNELSKILSRSSITLRCLTVDMGVFPVEPSGLEFSTVQDLCLKIDFGDDMYDDGYLPNLVGLSGQLSFRVSLDVSIGSSILSHEHAEMRSEIQTVQSVSKLCMRFSCPFMASMQRIWQQLELTATLHIYLHSQSLIDALEALPSTPRLYLHVDAMPVGKPVFTQWDALARNPGAIQIDMTRSPSACSLGILGCPGYPFQNIGKPWQLCVHGEVCVEGLPSSQPCSPARYLLQNKAAAAAGWSEAL